MPKLSFVSLGALLTYFSVGVAFIALHPSNAVAAFGDCAQPVSAGATPTASDALFVLRSAVGLESCELCVCDVDGSSATTASDALRTLTIAVGIDVSADCPACMSSCAPDLGNPSARLGATGVHDPVRDQLLLFGGDDAATAVAADCGFVDMNILGDLWIYDFDCAVWSQVPIAGGPGARERSSAAYDSARDRMLVFGGRYREQSGPYTLYNDVWAFDLTSMVWELLATSGDAPSPRFDTSAEYSVVDDALVVFGGNSGPSSLSVAPESDLAVLDLATLVWSKPATSSPKPSARLKHASAYDAADNALYVFGGGDENVFVGPWLGDLWKVDLDDKAWTLLDDGSGVGPAAKIDAHMGYDAAGVSPYLFGGQQEGALSLGNDVWRFDAGGTSAWQPIVANETLDNPATGFCEFPVDLTSVTPQTPERRASGVSAFNAATREFHVATGGGDCDSLDDLWSFDTATGVWNERVGAVRGEVCARAMPAAQCSALCE